MPSPKEPTELAPEHSPAPRARPERPVPSTDPRVAEAATEHTGIEPGQTVLIGLIHRPDGAKAMIRDPEGRVRTVTPGAHVGHAVVMAIGETSLFLERNGEEQVLSIPRGA